MKRTEHQLEELTRLVYANRYFHMITNETEQEYLGFLMLHGAMIKVGADLNYVAITKEIRNDFGDGEVTALNPITHQGGTLKTS